MTIEQAVEPIWGVEWRGHAVVPVACIAATPRSPRAAGGGAGEIFETIRKTGYGLRGVRAGGRSGAGTHGAGESYLCSRLAGYGGRDPHASAEGEP